MLANLIIMSSYTNTSKTDTYSRTAGNQHLWGWSRDL